MSFNFGGTVSKQWPTCPEGPQQVVCVDIIDLGLKQTDYGEKHKVRLVFQTKDLDEESGAPFQIGRQVTASLHEKATLSKMIESWTGKKLTDEDREVGVSEDLLLGANGYANVVHNENAGKTYANIDSIMPLPKGMAKIQAVAYIRAKDRPARDGSSASL